MSAKEKYKEKRRT